MFNIYKQKNRNSDIPSGGNSSSQPLPVAAKRSVNVDRYTDPTQEFGAKEFKWAMWYVKNKVLLYKIAVGGLAGMSAVLWVYSLLAWGNYLIFGIFSDQKLYQELTSFYNYGAINSNYAPQGLQVVATNIFQGGVKKYDLVSEVINPNPRFYVGFDYYFTVDGVKTPVQKAFLFPKQDSIIASLGLSSDSYPGGVEIMIENLNWKRITAHRIKDIEQWQNDRLRFEASGLVFTPAQPGSTDAPSANIIQFSLANESSFSYSEPKFIVGLFQGPTLVGVLPLELDKLKSQQTKKIDLRSFVPTLEVTEVKMYPLIDIYDSSVYLAPES